MEIEHGQIVRTVVPPPPQRKYLVLDSTGYVGADGVEWDVAELPNFRDYHVVIVDVRSLDKERLKTVSNARLKELRKALVLFLDSKGELIVLTDRTHYHKRPEQDPTQIDNYDWCPIYPRLSAESGDTLEVVSKDKFPKYLADLKKWPFCVALRLTICLRAASMCQRSVAFHQLRCDGPGEDTHPNTALHQPG